MRNPVRQDTTIWLEAGHWAEMTPIPLNLQRKCVLGVLYIDCGYFTFYSVLLPKQVKIFNDPGFSAGKAFITQKHFICGSVSRGAVRA